MRSVKNVSLEPNWDPLGHSRARTMIRRNVSCRNPPMSAVPSKFGRTMVLKHTPAEVVEGKSKRKDNVGLKSEVYIHASEGNQDLKDVDASARTKTECERARSKQLTRDGFLLNRGNSGDQYAHGSKSLKS